MKMFLPIVEALYVGENLSFPLWRGLGGGKNENPKFHEFFPASAIKALRKIGIFDDQTKVLFEHR
jgi:hypothetical protein